MPLNTEIYRDQEILEVRVNKIYMYILSLILFWFFLSIVLFADAILSSWEIELRLTHTDQWKLVGSIFLLIIFSRSTPCCCRSTVGKGPLEFSAFRIQMAMARFLLSLC